MVEIEPFRFQELRSKTSTDVCDNLFGAKIQDQQHSTSSAVLFGKHSVYSITLSSLLRCPCPRALLRNQVLWIQEPTPVLWKSRILEPKRLQSFGEGRNLFGSKVKDFQRTFAFFNSRFYEHGLLANSQTDIMCNVVQCMHPLPSPLQRAVQIFMKEPFHVSCTVELSGGL